MFKNNYENSTSKSIIEKNEEEISYNQNNSQ